WEDRIHDLKKEKDRLEEEVYKVQSQTSSRSRRSLPHLIKAAGEIKSAFLIFLGKEEAPTVKKNPPTKRPAAKKRPSPKRRVQAKAR
ncbi:MAG: hypothetical protein OXB93_00720, partial [Cytophagales bacterium]|nr:hypothetical protein [Cytophagales bacterium]